MRSATIVLVRHGHVVDNGRHEGLRLIGMTDVALSRRGEEEAVQLAGCLEQAPDVAGFYTSPLARARATAEAIEHVIGRAAEVAPELCEINCGELDGQFIEDVKGELPALWQRNDAQEDPAFRWPGGESYQDLRSRVVGWLGRAAERHAGQIIVAVTHTGFISQAVGAIHGLSPARWSAYRPGNTSLTTLRWSASGGVALVSFDVRACASPPFRLDAPGRDRRAG